jgi:Flp pilus assembly protein TadG
MSNVRCQERNGVLRPVRRRGQTMVEFAIVLVIFLGMLMAIFEGARLAMSAWMISVAARDGARAGIYVPSTSLTIATIDNRVIARVQATAARVGIVVPIASITICRHSSPDAAPTDSCDTAAPPLKSGSVVDVTVTHTFSFVPFAGGWLGQGNRTLTGYYRARIE